MKILMIMLSGVMLVNSQDMSKEGFEVITGTQVIVQGRVPVVAKNKTSNIKIAKSIKKAKKKAKKAVKKTSQKKKKVKSAKKKVVKKAIKKTKYNYRYNVGEIQHYIHQKIYEYGWAENDYYSIVQIVNRESSFNPYSVNKKSGSCGLFQAYPCSKMAKYGKDYRTNYKVQVKFGFEYIKARYQTPTKAWSFWQSHHWY